MESEVHKLELANGRIPFNEWYLAIADTKTRAVISSRLTRMRGGNLGDHKAVGGGVFELRIGFGPGFRVYFGRRGQQVIVLLGGGDKRSQARDIKTAQELWRRYADEAS